MLFIVAGCGRSRCCLGYFPPQHQVLSLEGPQTSWGVAAFPYTLSKMMELDPLLILIVSIPAFKLSPGIVLTPPQMFFANNLCVAIITQTHSSEQSQLSLFLVPFPSNFCVVLCFCCHQNFPSCGNQKDFLEIFPIFHYFSTVSLHTRLVSGEPLRFRFPDWSERIFFTVFMCC